MPCCVFKCLFIFVVFPPFDEIDFFSTTYKWRRCHFVVKIEPNFRTLLPSCHVCCSLKKKLKKFAHAQRHRGPLAEPLKNLADDSKQSLHDSHPYIQMRFLFDKYDAKYRALYAVWQRRCGRNVSK